MKKCNLTVNELKQNIIANMNVCYDEYKDRMMSEFPDVIWENCYAIALHRDLYLYLLYKINHLPRSALKYMQKPDLFETLKVDYYEGNYKPHYTDYFKMLDNYIKRERKLEMDEEME